MADKRVDTTQNASVTELFPALAFNKKFITNDVKSFRNFLDKLKFNESQVLNTFVNKSNIDAGKKVIDNLDNMSENIYIEKMNNAIGILNFLYDTHKSKPIDRVIWGYREKPNISGYKIVPQNHAGDIFVFYKSKEVVGISLKAGTEKSKEPLLNTYVGTTYKKLNKESELKKLENKLWENVYSKIPGVTRIANKNNYLIKEIKDKVTTLYVNYFVKNQTKADSLYNEMLLVSRQEMCRVINGLKLSEFIKWVKENFNLQDTKEEVPLLLVKAVNNKASLKADNLAQLLPSVQKFKARLNTVSVQGWFIDIEASKIKKTLLMTIRSDSGVRKEKKPGEQGRLGKYTMLKLQYSGIT